MRSIATYDTGEFHLKIPSSAPDISIPSSSKIYLQINQGTICIQVFLRNKVLHLFRNDSPEKVLWIQNLLKERISFPLTLWGTEFSMVPEGDRFVSEN